MTLKSTISTLLLLLLGSTQIYGVDKKYTYPPCLGVSLNGSTGIFYVPGAQTLDVGHLRASLLSGASNEYIPYSLTLGLSPKVEIFFSHNRQEHLPKVILELSQIGTKLNIFNWREGHLSLSLQSSNVKYRLSSENPSLRNHNILRSTLIAEYPFGNLRTLLQIGMHERDFEDIDKKKGLYFGAAASRPLWKDVHMSSEFVIDGPIPDNYEYLLSAGLKTFVIKHLQFGLVYSQRFIAEQVISDVQLMASFSTSPLKSFTLGSRENLWKDFKNLLSSIGLFSTPIDHSNIPPEFYVGPKDYELPLPPSMDLLVDKDLKDAPAIWEPEFIVPENQKLPQAPTLESIQSPPDK